MRVCKRDGSIEDFDAGRIYSALNSMSNSNEDFDIDLDMLKNHIERKISNSCDTIIDVEDIQDKVIDSLLCFGYKDEAKSYSEYRKRHEMNREMRSDFAKNLYGFLSQNNDDVMKDNANKNSKSVTTARDLLAGIVSKHFFVEHVMDKGVREAHKNGFIYQHDTDYALTGLTNCCLVNYPDMLKNGFKLGDALIETPKSIGVASTVTTQIVQGVASSQYGGQTLCEIDRYLSPYAEKTHDKIERSLLKYGINNQKMVDDYTEKAVYDAMQSLFYQVNTLHTVNGQSPFITISLGFDTSKYGRMITKSYLQIHSKGLGKHHVTPVFPKVIFLLQKGINMDKGDPNYDLKVLSMECSTKRIYPDYISVPLNHEVTGSKDEVVTSMGCRSFLSYWENGGGKEQYLGRANLGVVSVILPIIAQYAKDNNLDFWDQLNKYCEIAYKAHMDRINSLAKTKAGANPILFVQGALARLDPDEEIGKLFYNGRFSASLGYIGVAETCEILYGDIDRNKAKSKGLEIVKYLHDLCDVWYKRSRISFSLYGTPAETLCYKSVKSYNKLFNKKWDRDYFTNSFHLPVWEKSTPFEKWGYEEGFAKYSNGGNIGYIESPNLKDNMQALESMIEFAYHNIPYFGVNQPVDKCYKCGFEGEFNVDEDGYSCPNCGNTDNDTISVIRRVSGYLSAPDSRPFNKGKQDEVIDRVKHLG